MIYRYYIKDNEVVDVIEHNNIKNENYDNSYDVAIGEEGELLKYIEKNNITINRVAS